ncbi:signal transduction histidine kinase chea [hydrocarbon metagenome]|uniref:Chemotaxis protein CheA n=1 Tax=hydrocarbon metagenome TaxID=938273 RepID=A0A0W8FE37_9ZZZZ|nr:chemotaxis protein CheA [Methanomicrobiaceae archaeon]
MLDEEMYRTLFVAESRENHEIMAGSLIALENGDDGGAIDEIFRAAHTLKGMSASMGFHEMESLCHAMEDVFQLIRSGEVGVTKRLIDLLLGCADAIEEMLDDIEAGRPLAHSCSDALAQGLKAFIGESQNGETQQVADAGQSDITVADASLPCFTLQIRLDPACEMKGIRAMLVLQNLEDLGCILSTEPSRDRIEDGGFEEAFEVIVESDAGVEALRTAACGTEIADVRITAMEPPAPPEQPDLSQEAAEDIPDPVKSGKSREIRNIRVDIRRLDQMMNLVEDLVINRGRLEQIARRHGIKEFDEALAMVGRSVSDLQNLMMGIRMIPLDRIFKRLPRVVRDTARHDGKEVEFVMEGGETELDRSMMDGLADPLLHIIRNAVNHGIEPPDLRRAVGKPEKGRLLLSARRERDNVIIRIEDDGAGIDPEKLRRKAVDLGLLEPDAAVPEEELLELLFRPGFSTAETITDISGRGVGLDVVRRTIESLKGTIQVRSTPGEGTEFELVLPPTMAILGVMMVHIASRRCAIPVSSIVEVAVARQEAIHSIGASEAVILRNEVLPVHRLEDMFGASGRGETLVVLQRGGRKCCIVVDSVEGQQEVVVKPLSRLAGNCRGVSGVTIPGDGDVVPVLDVNTLV